VGGIQDYAQPGESYKDWWERVHGKDIEERQPAPPPVKPEDIPPGPPEPPPAPEEPPGVPEPPPEPEGPPEPSGEAEKPPGGENETHEEFNQRIAYDGENLSPEELESRQLNGEYMAPMAAQTGNEFVWNLRDIPEFGPGLEKEINALEESKRTATRVKEWGAIWDAEGDLLTEKLGGYTSITWDNAVCDASEGGILHHNHPFNADHYAAGASFSPGDLAFAARWDLSEIRAVESNMPDGISQWAYRLQRPEAGWPSEWGSNMGLFIMNNEMEVLYDVARAAVEDAVANGELHAIVAHRVAWHEAMLEWCERWEVPYTRRTISYGG
jgi:hypothetical protein